MARRSAAAKTERPHPQPTLITNIEEGMAILGLTAHDVAKHFGWDTAETFAKWRRGVRRISEESAVKMAELLRISVGELDPEGERYSSDERGTSSGRVQEMIEAIHDSLVRTSRNELNRPVSTPSSQSGHASGGPPVVPDAYLMLLHEWWGDLEKVDRERIADFAREVRATRQAHKKEIDDPNT